LFPVMLKSLKQLLCSFVISCNTIKSVWSLVKRLFTAFSSRF
jgi:hypothetical protein